MALKSGSSHAFSTLLLTILAAVFVQYLKEVMFFHYLFRINEVVSVYVASFLSYFFSVSIPALMIEYLFFAFFLSFLWGVVYHYSRS